MTQLQPSRGIPYVVMDNDTLNSISLKFDTTPAELARLNKRTLASYSIFPGDVSAIFPGAVQSVDCAAQLFVCVCVCVCVVIAYFYQDSTICRLCSASNSKSIFRVV